MKFSLNIFSFYSFFIFLFLLLFFIDGYFRNGVERISFYSKLNRAESWIEHCYKSGRKICGLSVSLEYWLLVSFLIDILDRPLTFFLCIRKYTRHSSEEEYVSEVVATILTSTVSWRRIERRLEELVRSSSIEIEEKRP